MKPTNKLFFSSLKQVEKRLKLDDGNPPPPPPPSLPPPPPPPPPPETTQSQTTDSLSSSPIYFHNQHTTSSSTLNSNSIEQPPLEFLSDNPNKFHDSENNSPKIIPIDDVDSMIRLLNLSDFDGKRPEEMPDDYDDEFYDKIVGVKGPKCKKEVERLDGWIKYYLLLNDNGRRGEEPLRLAHLLLGKAALLGSDGGNNEVEFPSTIDEFLQNDPPLLDY